MQCYTPRAVLPSIAYFCRTFILSIFQKRRQNFSLLLQLAAERPELFEEIVKYVEDLGPLSQTCRLLRDTCINIADNASSLVLSRSLTRRRTFPKASSSSISHVQDQLEKFVFKKQFNGGTFEHLVGRMLFKDEARAFATCEHFPGESELIRSLTDRMDIDSCYWMTPEWSFHRKSFLRSCRGVEVEAARALCSQLKIALRPAFVLRHDHRSLVYPMEAWWSIERTGRNIYKDRCMIGVIVHRESIVYKEAKRHPKAKSCSFVLVYMTRVMRRHLLGDRAAMPHRVPKVIPNRLMKRLVWMDKHQLIQQRTADDSHCVLLPCTRQCSY